MTRGYSSERIRSRLVDFNFNGVYRVIRKTHKNSPLSAVPAPSRFSDPNGSYAVLYAADKAQCSFWEAVVRGRFDHQERRVLAESELRSRLLVTLCSTESLQLVDLRDDGPIRIGVPTAVCHDANHSAGRALSAAIVSQVGEADGLVYTSRFTGDLCFAIFDHAFAKLEKQSVAPLIEHQALIDALEEYDISLCK